ncbi:MAG: hypothetical protein QW350_05195 [Candidatus Aenigmatarchaeota archaeon]
MEAINVKKLFVLSKNPNVDRGELVVENQSQPYRYPDLVINIDVSPRSYEHYIELVRKEKINLHGLYGKTWLYLFEPSYEFASISVSVQNGDDIFWDISCTNEDSDNQIGVIVHAHRLSELYNFLKKLKEKPIISFKSYDNFYLNGVLHETIVEEKVDLFLIEENEIRNFFYQILNKKLKM